MSNQLPTLYKKTKTGAIQQWTISVTQQQLFDIESGDGKIYSYPYFYGYLISFGQVGGEIQKKFNITKGKNIGKSNETTSLQQAELEAKSRWLKQLDKGYVENLKDDIPPLLPMLAHKYIDHSSKVKFPCLVQPKINGIRCLARVTNDGVVLTSRKGKVFQYLQHIEEEIFKHFNPGMILDGELYIHGEPLQQIRSLTAKEYEETKNVQLHVYDIVDIEECFYERFYTYQEYFPNSSIIRCVSTHKVESTEHLMTLHKSFKDSGYEGSIIRDSNGMYEINKRSYNLLKLKDFLDEEFEIIGAEENKNSPGQCSLILITKDGKEFKSKPEGDTEFRESIWKNHKDLIGKMATVRFFEWTPDKIPFHGVVECIRDYE